MATRSGVIDAVEVALSGQLDVDVFGPNRLQDVPDPDGDPNDPTTFIAWTLGDEEWDPDGSSFGARFYRGSVLFGLHTEIGGGELDFATYAATLETTLLGASVSGLHFYEAQQGGVIDDEAWSGRVLEIPYSREEAKA